MLNMLESRFINMDNYHLYTRIASNTNLVSIAIWSPDGKAVAYSARVNGVNHVFLRYLNSSNPVQVTHEKRDISSLGWSSDRRSSRTKQSSGSE